MTRSIRDFKFEPTPDEIDTVSGIDYYTSRKAEISLIALCHNLRHQIVRAIHENKGLNLSQLSEHLKIEQAILSHQLIMLKRARIVSVQRVGKTKLCTVNSSRIVEINELAKIFIGKAAGS